MTLMEKFPFHGRLWYVKKRFGTLSFGLMYQCLQPSKFFKEMFVQLRHTHLLGGK